MSAGWTGNGRRLRALLGLAALLCLLRPPLAAQGNCGCDPDAHWDDALSKASVVFVGTCMDATPNAIKGGMNVLFQIDSSWKRAIEPVATVHTNAAAQCGYPFEKGVRYIVFANKRHQTVETSICEPNQRHADGGAAVLARLGPGIAPGRTELAGNMNLMLVAAGLLGLVFVAFVVLRKRFVRAKPLS
jgi:hypothetical protein